ncbi:MAG: M50 family metallopeptidase [Lachnospiraceae bacterium]
MMKSELPIWQKTWLSIAVLAQVFFASYIQIIVHEAGHLAAGLLSGYQFSSFRIGSFMLVKDAGKMKCKRLFLAGTGGQCLMNPPDMIDGKIPYFLYNLGGSLLNIVVALLSFGISFILGKDSLFVVFFLSMGVIGMGYALLNGIPMKSGMSSNDGYNAKELGKMPEALHSFWVQMKVMEMTAKGSRLKDMPKEWFYLPDEMGMKNEMTAVMAVFYENRLMDQMELEQAENVITELLSGDYAIAGIYRNMLVCDQMFCELLQEEKRAHAMNLYDKTQKKFMKQMKNFPSVIRTEYAYLLLGKNDKDGAKKAKKRFDKCTKTHPYVSDIESERELIQVAERAAF